jgi:nicotinate phosphoribosyltransferase
MNLSLLMDLYELTMVAGYLRQGMHDKPAVFDLYFRRNPFGGGYAVFAGLDPVLDYLERLRFGDEEIGYLRGLGLFDEVFLSYMRAFRFTGKVTSVPEGEIVFSTEPILTVEAPLAQAQIIETALLNLINFQTLVATKAARMVREAAGGTVVEFGARRAHGPDGAAGASRAACVGGARVTSNLMAGRRFGIPVAGTQAHSWVMAFPSEREAFSAYAASFPDHCVLLVDTYDTLRSGVPNAITVAKDLRARGHELAGIRLDSGDLAYLSKQARRMLDEAGFPHVRIVASNELDEHIIESIRMEGGRVDIYGVGTHLAAPAGDGGAALGGVYKLVEIDGQPRIKVSSDRAKSTLPGRKRLWRMLGNGGFEMDVLSASDESPGPGDPVLDPMNPLRHTTIPQSARLDEIRSVVMAQGARTSPARPLAQIADYAQARLALLPEGCLRLLNPHVYRVAMTRKLHEMRDRMIEDVSHEYLR